MPQVDVEPNGVLAQDGGTTIVGGAPDIVTAITDNTETTYVTVAEGFGTTSSGLQLALGTFALDDAVVYFGAVFVTVRQNQANLGAQAVYVSILTVRNGYPVLLNEFTNDDDLFDDGTFWIEQGGFSGPLSQSDIDNMYLKIRPLGEPIDLDQVGVSFFTVPPPQVAVSAPASPYSDSTVVPISWTNTIDVFGGPQTRYRIRVFDATTYGVLFTGLDPDTDTPFWDSGERIGSVNFAEVGPLPDGDTYSIWVAVGVDFAGEPLWSRWQSSDITAATVEIDVASADILSVTANPVAAAGRIDITVNRDTGTGVAWDLILVERQLNGGDWQPVRGAYIVDATGDADTFTVSDYEAGNSDNAVYRARSLIYSSGLPVFSAWVSSPTVSWASDDVWLKDPLDASNNRVVVLRSPIDLRRTMRRGVHVVAGSAEAITVTDGLKAPDHTLIVRSDDVDEAEALVDMLDASPVLLLHAPPTMPFRSRYIAPGNVDVSPIARRTVRELFEVTYTDCITTAAPADGNAGTV